MFLLKIIGRFLLLLPILGFSQESTLVKKEIDSLLQKSEIAYEKFDDTQSLVFAKKAKDLALQINDIERLSISYCLLARTLSVMEIQKESMMYIEKAEKLGYGKKNQIKKSELSEIKAFNFSSLGLFNLSLEENLKILNFLKNNNSFESIKIKLRVYGNIGNHYYRTNELDSVAKYVTIEENLAKKIDPATIGFSLPDLFDAKGYLCLKKTQYDDALYYFKKGYEIKIKQKDPIRYVQYCSFADYYLEKENYTKALEFYLKTLENIKQYKIKQTGYTDVYKTVSDIYAKLNNPKQEKIYLKKYTNAIDSINKLKIEKINYVTQMSLTDFENKNINNSKKQFLILFITTISCILIAFFIYKKYFVSKKEHHSTIEKHKSMALSKAAEAQNEIINLAKSNNINFYSSFQKVYPTFQKKLFEINDELHLAELNLLAYIFLGFESKEIAEYTFKSIRTIQNQKNKLRKKLNLDSSENFNLWIKKTIDN